MDLKKMGKFIYELRNEKGLTQKQLAEKLFVTDKAVSKWETGNGMPDSSLLIPLGTIFDVSVNEILCGERMSESDFVEKSNDVIVETLQLAQKKPINSMMGIVIITIAIMLICALQTPVRMVEDYMARTYQVIYGYYWIYLINIVRGVLIGCIVFGIITIADIDKYFIKAAKSRIKKWIIFAFLLLVSLPFWWQSNPLNFGYTMIIFLINTILVSQHLFGCYAFLLVLYTIKTKMISRN